MILDVPFVYQIAYVPKGKRNPEHTEAIGNIQVDVAETSGKLAFEIGCPLARRTGYGSRTRRCSPFHAEPGKTVRVWRAEDAYWVEICPAAEARARIAARHEMPRDPFAVGRVGAGDDFVENLSPDPKRHKFRTREELEKEHVKLRSWDDGDRDRVAVRLMSRAAEDVRVIDGHLCMRVSEPVLDSVYVAPPPPPPKPTYEGRGRFRRKVAGYVPENPDAEDGIAPGHHLVVAQITAATPAGFSLEWELHTEGAQRWRIDQLDAAVAFARADEARRPAPPEPGSLLLDPAVTIGFADVSSCKHEGLSSILAAEIDRVRKVLVDHVTVLDRELLACALDLQHAFERDGGRPTAELIALARRALGLYDAGHRPSMGDRHVASVLRVFGQDVVIARDVAPVFEGLRLVLSHWDRRDQAACEWIDRTLPIPVLPGAEVDVVEVATLQLGQDLVDAGCDPAALRAVADAARGDGRVVAAETPDGKPLGYAASLREDADGLAVDRVFAPRAANPAAVAAMRGRFEAFVAVNREAAAENELLAGMAL